MDAALKTGDLVAVSARVTDYQGKPQLEATKVAAAPAGSAEARDFMPCTYRDVDELKGFLQFHIDSVHDRDYAAMLPVPSSATPSCSGSSPPLRRPSSTTTPTSAA